MAESRIRSKADVIKEQKCEACGGSLVFDPKSGKLVCEYCEPRDGKVYPVIAVPPKPHLNCRCRLIPVLN